MYLAIAIVLATIAIAAVLGWRRRRAALRREAARSGLPVLPIGPGEPAPREAASRVTVVLIHGILGFESFGLGRARVHYFRRVARRLEARGLDVHVVTLPMLGGVPARGLALLAQLDKLPHDARLVLIAHSLGGLDARWAIARGGLGPRVRALVTIGTPHRGTPIADALARGPAVWLRRALARLGLGSDGVDWLTTEKLAAFNRDTPDVPGVTYACVVSATVDARRVHPLLRVTHGFLASGGPSDGLVPAASQTWGTVLAEAEIDHWAQIGWSGGHDAAARVERALDALTPADPARSSSRPPGCPPAPALAAPAASRARPVPRLPAPRDGGP
jgi:triacylglycerol lipase